MNDDIEFFYHVIASKMKTLINTQFKLILLILTAIQLLSGLFVF